MCPVLAVHTDLVPLLCLKLRGHMDTHSDRWGNSRERAVESEKRRQIDLNIRRKKKNPNIPLIIFTRSVRHHPLTHSSDGNDASLIIQEAV